MQFYFILFPVVAGSAHTNHKVYTFELLFGFIQLTWLNVWATSLSYKFHSILCIPSTKPHAGPKYRNIAFRNCVERMAIKMPRHKLSAPKKSYIRLYWLEAFYLMKWIIRGRIPSFAIYIYSPCVFHWLSVLSKCCDFHTFICLTYCTVHITRGF